MFDDFAQGDEIVPFGQDGFVGGIIGVEEGDNVSCLLSDHEQNLAAYESMAGYL